MPKSLGSKRREISDECKKKILKLVKAGKEGPHVKVFDSTDFGYREIKVQRPLRLRFEVTSSGLEELGDQTAFRNLAVSKKKDPAIKEAEELEGRKTQEAIRKALHSLSGTTFLNREEFIMAVEEVLNDAGLKLKAPVLKAILTSVSKKDDEADICLDKQGNREPDKDLSDTETVPLKEDIEVYFDREVLPHVPDAWIDQTYQDDKDGQVGRVGYEIPFNRHFYIFQPPRALKEIDADLKGVTDKILNMIGDVTQ